MNLRRQVFSATRWVAVSSALRFLLQLVQTMVLARLLLPAEFGLMAVAGGFLAIMVVFADVGLNRALIRYRDLGPEALSSVFWLNLLVSLGLVLLVAALSPLFSAAFGEAGLTGVLAVASLTFPLSALGMQFKVLAEKELQFAALARNEVTAAVMGFMVATAMALTGFGVYALVGGALANTATSSLLAWIWLSAGHRPSWHLRMAEVRPMLGFGSYLVGERLANAINTQADLFIGGLVAGPAAMGVYSVPRSLSLRLANTFVNPIVGRVGYPVMAKLQDDPPALRKVYLETLRMTASVNFPIYLLLAFFAPEVVGVLYGPRWHDAAFYLGIFAIWGLVRSTVNPVGGLLAATGHAHILFWWNVTLLGSISPILWLAGSYGGLEGMAWTLLVFQFAFIWPAWRYMVKPACGAVFGEYVARLALPFALALAATAAGAWTAHLVGQDIPRLVVGTLVTGVLYLVLSYRFNRPWLDAMVTLMLPGRKAPRNEG